MLLVWVAVRIAGLCNLWCRFGIIPNGLHRTLENVRLPDRNIYRFDGSTSISFGFNSERLGRFHRLLLGTVKGCSDYNAFTVRAKPFLNILSF